MAPIQIPSATPTTHTTPGYVLPSAPRGRSTLVIDPEDRQAATDSERNALCAAGSRMQALLECQQQFFGELRLALAETGASVHEEPRARIMRHVAQLGEILEWCEAVQADLMLESQRAAMGWQAVELGEALHEAAARQEAQAEVSVLVSGHASSTWWGKPAELDRALGLALQIVTARIGGTGSIQVELGEGEQGHTIRVLGLGEPRPIGCETLVRSFRAAAAAIGAKVAPDALGVGGSGFLLRLPTAAGSSS